VCDCESVSESVCEGVRACANAGVCECARVLACVCVCVCVCVYNSPKCEVNFVSCKAEVC
jgi:hypothetical protein